MTRIKRSLALSLTSLLAGLGVAAAAQANTETFRFVYAAAGTYASQSQVDDNAGCRRKEDWVAKYAVRQRWTVKVSVTAHRLVISRTPTYVGGDLLPGRPTSLDVTGSQVAQPGEACEWAGGSNDAGRYQCSDAHPKFLYDSHLRLSQVGKTIVFRAPAFVTYNPTLRGTDSIPSLKTTGCLSFDYSPGLPLPGPDIVVRIPVKAATLYHLKLGHYFFVRPSLGHYGVAPDQTGHSCFQVTRGPSDFCRVTSDVYQGQVGIKRLS
jgi:hypothetical protein